MSGFLAVFQREVVERKPLLGVALLTGLFALSAPWLPQVARHDPAEVRAAAALLLGGLLAVSFGLALGGSMLGGDVATGRAGFYFARPIAGWAIWAGKLAAALALTLSAFLLAFLPGALVGGRALPPLAARTLPPGASGGVFAGPLGAAAALVLAGIALVLIGHAARALAARSGWLPFDLFAGATVALLAWQATTALTAVWAFTALRLALSVFAATLLLALLSASAGHLVGGRADERRGRRAFSGILWAVALPAALAFAAYSRWFIGVEPTDLISVDRVRAAPRGAWVLVSGPARRRVDFVPAFLWNLETGHYARVGGLDRMAGLSFSFSTSGSHAAWLEMVRNTELNTELILYDLERERLSRLSPPFSGWEPLALSPDGSRLAAAADGRITVLEVPGGRLLAAPELPRKSTTAIVGFRSTHRITVAAQVAAEAQNQVELWDLDLTLSPARLQQRGSFGPLRGFCVLAMSEDAQRLVVRGERPGEGATARWLLSLPEGEVLAELAAPRGWQAGMAADLEDRRWVTVDKRGPAHRVAVYSRDGVFQREFLLDQARGLRLGGQPTPHELAVAAWEGHAAEPRWRSYLLDLERGSVSRLTDRFRPAASPGVGPRSFAARLFLGPEGAFAILDPATRELRPFGAPSTAD